jgi:hypothetical protein
LILKAGGLEDKSVVFFMALALKLLIFALLYAITSGAGSGILGCNLTALPSEILQKS